MTSKNIKKRSPIIVVLGHVDHGKTTLLDYIRKTNTAEKEAGGITQSVGAYEINHQTKTINNENTNYKITFIDTPGHEAFKQMRLYGTKIADIAILIVAADDGLMPQTKESLELLKQTQTPFIVAINKIDKNNADIEKVKKQLLENEVYLEGYGGNISWQPISAKTGEGINELLDLIVLTAEMEDLKYDPEGPTKGFILTAKKDLKKGNIVSLIVKDGCLKTGQYIFTKKAEGKIKSLEDFLGQKTNQIFPSSPAIVLGFENLPNVGEEFYAFSNLEEKIEKQKTIYQNQSTVIKEDNSFKDFQKNQKILKIILRAEEIGALAAVKHLIEKIKSELPLLIINEDIGNIYENEIKLAHSTQALIIGFKVKIDKAAQNLMKSYGIKVITSEIIYELEKKLKEELTANFQNRGEVKILKIFGQRKNNKQILGGLVINGFIKNKDKFEIFKNEENIGTGKILNLQVNKKDSEKAEKNQEIGLLVESNVFIEENCLLIFK